VSLAKIRDSRAIRVSIFCAWVVLWFWADSGVGAQVTYQRIDIPCPNPQFYTEFGRSIAVADIDRDGFDDLITGHPGASLPGAQQAGKLWIHYGPQFIRFAEILAPDPEADERLGSKPTLTLDVNGDGHLDLVALAPGADSGGLNRVGRVRLLLGPDFTHGLRVESPVQQEETQFGDSAAILPHPDGSLRLMVAGDGWENPFVTPPLTILNVGKVFSIRLPDLEFMGELLSPDPGAFGPGFGVFGFSMLQADLTGDGVEELIVTEPGRVNWWSPQPGQWETIGRGAVWTFDGATQEVEHAFFAPSLQHGQQEVWSLGYSPLVVDLTGDNIPDLLVGAPETTVNGHVSEGEALLLEGPGFTQIAHIFRAPVPEEAGGIGQRMTVGDYDGNGAPDVALLDVGPPEGEERIWVLYGPGYEQYAALGTELPLPIVGHLGFGMALATGDFDGNGRESLVTSAALGNGFGEVYVYDPQTLLADTESLSMSAGGSVHFALHLGREQASQSYVGVIGTSGSKPGQILGHGSFLPVKLDQVSVLGWSLKNTPLMPGFAGTLDAEGSASFALLLPPGVASSLAGTTLTVAAVVHDAEGFGAGSSAVEISLLP